MSHISQSAEGQPYINQDGLPAMQTITQMAPEEPLRIEVTSALMRGIGCVITAQEASVLRLCRIHDDERLVVPRIQRDYTAGNTFYPMGRRVI